MRLRVPLATTAILGFLVSAVPSPSRAASPDPGRLVQARRAIEEVYWKHRIWPVDNSRPKPPLAELISEDQLRAKAEDPLRMSAALATWWGRPVTREQLQAEIDRMTRETRAPQALNELFAALGNDAELIAESLARPLLAERLLRKEYAFDAKIHAAVRARAETDLADAPDLALLKARADFYSERDAAGASPDSTVTTAIPDLPAAPRATLRETTDAFVAELRATGADGKPVVGRFVWRKRPFESWWSERRATVPADVAPEPEAARPYRVNAVTAAPCLDGTWRPTASDVPDPRLRHVAVWTGSEMIVWGGLFYGPGWNTGGRYDPATDTWTPTSLVGAPTPRRNFTAVWTGTEMIVWGGVWAQPPSYSAPVNTGGRYDPVTDSWLPTSVGAGVPSPRSSHTAVWTGSRMIVWGGQLGPETRTGAQYDPFTDTWVPTSMGANVPAARFGHTAVWTGTEMIVWGGSDAYGLKLNTGGRYNPASDTWVATALSAASPTRRDQHTAVWTGSRMIVWGGLTFPYGFERTGARYDPATDTWSPTAITAATPSIRGSHTAVWTGTEMIIWGGDSGDVTAAVNTGARYNPLSDSWIATPAGAGAPDPRTQHTAVWTGTEMIVWGGRGQPILNTGGRYSPASDSWLPTASTGPTPSARTGHAAVWTGSEMIVWGGGDAFDGTYFESGGKYDPATGAWTPTSLVGAPSGRTDFSAIWTGIDLIVWGGHDASGVAFNTGGKYNPLNDGWIPTATLPWAPAPRFGHTAVWTGNQMIVWGGGDIVGGRYDPYADTWVGTNTGPGVPSGRRYHAAVWTGSEMLVWGGITPEAQALMDGSRYSPAADRWTPMSGTNAPSARYLFPSVWSGHELIVWGGASQLVQTGARYDPRSDSWTPTSTAAGVPSARTGHAAVWTGTEMVVWGSSEDPVGGRYDPAGDSWSPMGTDGAPPVRQSPSAVWTGNEMIVWGGSPRTATGGQYCVATAGCSGDPSVCDDGDPCTDDSCDPGTHECAHTPVNCEDTDPCTYDFCDPRLGCANIPVPCDDGDACTVDFCDPASGCGSTPRTCPDDGNPCTASWCDPATGCHEAPIDCTDGDPCTTDTCNPATGQCEWTPGACGGCPNSDRRPTVIIGACDTGVPNRVLSSGCSIADLLHQCRLNSPSRRDYLACVWDTVRALRNAGVISGKEAARILKCATRKRDHDSRTGHHSSRDDHADGGSDSRARGRSDPRGNSPRPANHGQHGGMDWW